MHQIAENFQTTILIIVIIEILKMCFWICWYCNTSDIKKSLINIENMLLEKDKDKEDKE